MNVYLYIVKLYNEHYPKRSFPSMQTKFIIKAQDDIFVHMIYCPFQGKSCRNVFLERHVRHISCLVDYFYMYFLHSDRKKLWIAILWVFSVYQIFKEIDTRLYGINYIIGKGGDIMVIICQHLKT